MANKGFDLETEIAVIGAGPAGSATSIFLSQKGIKHTLFEKAQFPRDKICGDGLSGKVVSLLRKMDAAIISELENSVQKSNPSWGVRFIAPNGRQVDIPFYLDSSKKAQAPGFVMRRLDFDHILMRRIDPQWADLRLGSEVVDVEYGEKGIVLHIKNGAQQSTCLAQLVIAAEGDRSVVAKKLAGQKLQPEHYYAGLRVYYENVHGMHPENYVELHFLKDLLPGYFWIFPLPNNQANVGLGLLTQSIKNKRINLKELLRFIIHDHPLIKDRFKEARPLDEMRGWGLPLGSARRPLSGERFVLTGDAGALIDPLTGEGIGNALVSARLAAQVVEQALQQKDYSANFLKQYDDRVYDELWGELKLSRFIQHLVRLPWLFNFVFNRLHNNKTLQETFSAMLNDLDMRARLRSPSFYFRVLFNSRP